MNYLALALDLDGTTLTSAHPIIRFITWTHCNNGLPAFHLRSGHRWPAFTPLKMSWQTVSMSGSSSQRKISRPFRLSQAILGFVNTSVASSLGPIGLTLPGCDCGNISNSKGSILPSWLPSETTITIPPCFASQALPWPMPSHRSSGWPIG